MALRVIWPEVAWTICYIILKFGFWKVLQIYWYFLCGQICSECPYCVLRRIFSVVRISCLCIFCSSCSSKVVFFVIVYIKPKTSSDKIRKKTLNGPVPVYILLYGSAR